ESFPHTRGGASPGAAPDCGGRCGFPGCARGRAAYNVMRVEAGILVLTLLLGLALYALSGLLGLFLASPWVFGLAAGIRLVLYLLVVMAQNAVSIRELVKQIAVWLGIVVLLPLAVWYGTSAFSPPPDWKRHSRDNARLDEKVRDAKGEAEKEKLRQEKERLE